MGHPFILNIELQCMLNDIRVEIDMSENDCEEELYQSRECD